MDRSASGCPEVSARNQPGGRGFQGGEATITGPHEAVKTANPAWLGLVSSFQTGVFAGERIVHATLLPELHPEHAALRSFQAGWPGALELSERPDGLWSMVLREQVGPGPKVRWWIHVGLFALTVLTTMGAGALMLGDDPFSMARLTLGPLAVPIPVGVDLRLLLTGAPFSATLVCILLAHEMGHVIAARAHRVAATLPFFLPFPPYFSVVGTLGAFIRLRGALSRRSVLTDIGAAGPCASFVLSVLALGWGLPRSTLVSGYADPWTPFAIAFMGQPIWLGAGPLTWVMGNLVLPGSLGDELVRLHPVAFAGWLGLFITMLNLLPFGQLDGGHILYGLLGRRQGRVGRGFLLLLLPLGFLWWGWWFWAVAAVLLSRGRMTHPDVLQPWEGLGPRRRLVALGAILIFFLCFSPVPIGF